MKISYAELLKLAKNVDGEIILTLKRKCPFHVKVHPNGKGITYTPQSTDYSRKVSKDEIDRVLRMFDQLGSFTIKDYTDISRNASYTLALIKHFIEVKEDGSPSSLTRVVAQYEDEVMRSMQLTPKELHHRAELSSTMPSKIFVTTTTFVRNPHVAAFVLQRAAGICEHCKQVAPFKRSSNREPYLEVHHVKRLADGGLDSIENAIALCPNCHRKAHYG